MHRRLDDAVAGAGLRSRGGKILDAHAGLAAVTPDISLVVGFEHPRVGCRRGSLDRDAHAVCAIADRRDCTDTVDRDGHGVRAHSAELKAVARRPRRACFGWLIWRGVAIRRFASGLTLEQMRGAERGGGEVGLVRYRSKRGKVAVDESGV